MSQELKPGKLYRYGYPRSLWEKGPYRTEILDTVITTFISGVTLVYIETHSKPSERKTYYDQYKVVLGYWHKVIIGDAIGWLYNEEADAFIELKEEVTPS